MSDHTKGILITALGVLFISPDTLLIRLIDMSVWNVAIWRGSMQSVGLTGLLLCFYGKGVVDAFRAIGIVGFGVALVFSINTLCFIAAVTYTSVANVLVILASTPFFAAILSIAFLRERVPPRTWLAIFLAGSGIALIVFDNLGSTALFGDLMAILAATLLALKFTILRRRRHVNMIPALAISGLVFAAVSCVMTDTIAVPDASQALWLLIMGFAVLTPAVALITLGPRYISAPEVGLLMLLETVLGPLWVWLVLSEEPSAIALFGGGVVIVTLLVHGILGLRAVRPVPAS